MGHRIIALMIKEFLALLKDKKSRTILIVPPMIQLIVFGYAATFDVNRVTYGVYNEDRGAVSRDLLARFAGAPSFGAAVRIDHSEEMKPLIDNKEVLLVLHLGPTFSRDILLGRSAPLQVIIDGRNSNTALVVLGYLRRIIMEFNLDLARAEGRDTAPAVLDIRAWYNPNLESRWFIVPGIVGLLTLVVTLLVTALSVAREREAGTFDQLLVTPLSPTEILLGKALPGFIIGFAEASVIILIAVHWFHIPLEGSLAALYTGLFLFLLSSIGVGLMVSSFSLTQQQGLFGAFLFLVPAITLSGFATPIANMPQYVQWLTLANPLRYFLIILREIFLEGASFSLLWPQFWPMAVIGTVNLFVAGSLFRRRMY